MNQDDAIAKMLEKAPLLRFSPYSRGQVETIRNLSVELIKLMDDSINGNEIDGQSFQRIYSLFWLWVLGAYEITRTMNEYNKCFSVRLNEQVLLFKNHISILRIPFAKLQFRGREKRPINGEASVYSIDLEQKDLTFKVRETIVSVRAQLAEFERLVEEIKPEDVLFDIREAYK